MRRLKLRNDVYSRRGRREEGRNLREEKFSFARKLTILNVFAQLSQDLGFKGLIGIVTAMGGVIFHRKLS